MYQNKSAVGAICTITKELGAHLSWGPICIVTSAFIAFEEVILVEYNPRALWTMLDLKDCLISHEALVTERRLSLEELFLSSP